MISLQAIDTCSTATAPTPHVPLVSMAATTRNKEVEVEVEDPRVAALRREAAMLHPILSSLRVRYDSSTISGADLVAAFILTYLSVRRPGRWASGKLSKPIISHTISSSSGNSTGTTACNDLSLSYVKVMNYDRLDDIPPSESSTINGNESIGDLTPIALATTGVVVEGRRGGVREGRIEIRSKSIASLPELAALMPDAFAKKWFGNRGYDISLFEIFNTIKFTGIKKNTDDLVNHAMANWMASNRPFELLFHIPSPMEVLRMQANGRRVVSMLATLKELGEFHFARLTYMKGAKLAEKDAFDFLIHDLTHMEHFTHHLSYYEQVGFMRSMLSICDGKPKRLFANVLFPFDKTIWSELEYLISDMNCFSPHFMRYLIAKVLLACVRNFIIISADTYKGYYATTNITSRSTTATTSDISSTSTCNMGVYVEGEGNSGKFPPRPTKSPLLALQQLLDAEQFDLFKQYAMQVWIIVVYCMGLVPYHQDAAIITKDGGDGDVHAYSSIRTDTASSDTNAPTIGSDNASNTSTASNMSSSSCVAVCAIYVFHLALGHASTSSTTTTTTTTTTSTSTSIRISADNTSDSTSTSARRSAVSLGLWDAAFADLFEKYTPISVGGSGSSSTTTGTATSTSASSSSSGTSTTAASLLTLDDIKATDFALLGCPSNKKCTDTDTSTYTNSTTDTSSGTSTTTAVHVDANALLQLTDTVYRDMYRMTSAWASACGSNTSASSSNSTSTSTTTTSTSTISAISSTTSAAACYDIRTIMDAVLTATGNRTTSSNGNSIDDISLIRRIYECVSNCTTTSSSTICSTTNNMMAVDLETAAFEALRLHFTSRGKMK